MYYAEGPLTGEEYTGYREAGVASEPAGADLEGTFMPTGRDEV